MGSHAKILVVEDEPISRDLLATILSGEGHEVQTAPDAFGALELIRQGRFDGIIVDYHLPEMDGYAFARLIRDLTRDQPRPPLLVAITGDRDGLALRRGSDGIFRAILAKPVRPHELLGLIGEAAAAASAATVRAAAQSLVADPVAATASAASRAYWRAAGLPDCPRAWVWPAPSEEQARALSLCFRLVDASAPADILVLTSLEGIEGCFAEQGRERALLPIVSVNRLDSPLIDGEFSLLDRTCWSQLSSLIRETGARRDSLPDGIRGSDRAIDRTTAFLHVRGRHLPDPLIRWVLGLEGWDGEPEQSAGAVGGRGAAVPLRPMPAVTGAGHESVRVLLIEPVELVQDILSAMLRGAGYGVAVAEGEDAAAAALTTNGFDLVVASDELWGAATGLAAAFARGAHPGTALILTRAGQGAAGHPLPAAPGVATVSRPIRPRELLAAAERLIEERDAAPAHDPEVLAELVATIGQDAADRLVAKFRDELAAVIARCPGWPAATLRREAHKLKGAAGLLGFARLATSCGAAEHVRDEAAAVEADRLARSCRTALAAAPPAGARAARAS